MQDLRGLIFGHWTVLDADPIPASGHYEFKYLCRCACGNEKWVRAGNLKRGISTNCGCMRGVKPIDRRDVEVDEEMVQKMTQMEKQVVDLYNAGYSITTIGTLIHKSKTTVRAILDKAGIDRIEINKQKGVSEEKKEAIIRLYENGEKQYMIAVKIGVPNSTVRAVLSQAGLIKPRRNEGAYYGAEYNESSVTHQRFKEAIKPIDIWEKRASIHVGDEIRIPTLKTGGSKTKFQVVDPVMKPAVVVNADHPRFCVCKLVGSGVTDCVNWVDLIMIDRLIEKNNKALEV